MPCEISRGGPTHPHRIVVRHTVWVEADTEGPDLRYQHATTLRLQGGINRPVVDDSLGGPCGGDAVRLRDA
jgi:hypothetical protein